jgi:phytanoyl-CoA hydroxylase
MKVEVSDDDVVRFRSDGFIVVPGCLDADELSAWREKSDREVAASPVLDDGRGYMPSIRARDFSRNDAEWASMTQCAELVGAAARLSGASSLRLIAEQLSYCYPNYPATPWHSQQLEDVMVDDRSALTAHIELDDSSVQGKCYVFLPGSHRDAPVGSMHLTSPGRDATRTFESIFDIEPAWREIDPVAAECPAGSVLFYYLSVVHACGPNMTRATRRYVGPSWAPGDAVWNGRGHVSARSRGTMRQGHPFDDTDYPVVWPLL